VKALWLLFFSLVAQAAPSADFFADLEQFHARSLVLRSEREHLEAEGNSTLAKLLAFTPSLSAGLGKYRDSLKGASASQSPTYNTNYEYWRAQADWNLFHGGADYHALGAQQKVEEAQRFQLKSQELQVELDGAKLLFRRLYLLDVLKAQAELQRLKEESLKIGRDRFTHGRIPLQEVAKMEVDLAQQQNVVRQSEIDIAENEAAYRALFVEDLHTRDWPFVEGQKLDFAPSSGSFATKSLSAKAEGLEESWKSSKGKWWPSLDFSLKYLSFPLRGGNPGTEWTGTLELSLPLWSHYETVAENAQAYASFVQARNEAESAVKNESEQNSFLRKKTRLSEASLVAARQVLEKSDRLYQDELRSFQLGRLSTNDLFQEQARKIQSLLSYAQSRLSYHEGLMEACALAGQSARTCLR
jgi:outer membrane protein TolC